MEKNNLYISNLRISGRDDILDKEYGITPDVKSLIKSVYSDIKNGKINDAADLKDLMKKYPHIPQFKNSLSVFYTLRGKKIKAHRINMFTNICHPDYLFGKLALANDFIDLKDFNQVPKLLGDLMDLKALYPNREEFHFSEVEGFLTAAIRYFTGIKNIEAAESRLEILKGLNPDNNHIEYLQNDLDSIKIEKGLERWENEKSKGRSVKAIPKKVVAETTKKPQFNNQIIEKLYEHDLNIDTDIIKEILALPAESLIDDLHKVCYDSIARFKYFKKNTVWDDKTHNFSLHAVLLLSELNSGKSLQVILDLFRQGCKYTDYWFGDLISEYFWQPIYTLGLNQLNMLSDFLKEPGRECYLREEVSIAAAQIALHNPSRRMEIVDWYKDIFRFFIENISDDRIIDTELNGLMINDVLDLNAIELLPEIKKLYENNLVNPGVCGSFEDVLKEFRKPLDNNRFNNNRLKNDYRRKLYNIFENYKYIAENFSNSKDDKVIPKKSNFHANSNSHSEANFPESSIKAGRNDPCPCGRGVKYKKCCGK